MHSYFGHGAFNQPELALRRQTFGQGSWRQQRENRVECQRNYQEIFVEVGQKMK